MSLLDELTDLDFSAVLSARATISSSSGGLNVALEGGAALSALGDLGTAIEAIQSGIEDPADLLRPLLELLLELAEPLRDDIPIGPWFEAVQNGIRVLLEVIEALNGDPSGLTGLLSDSSTSDLIKRAHDLVDDYSAVSLSGLTQFRQLVEIVEGRMPDDPADLAELAVRLLQPFEGRQLRQLRTAMDALLSAAGEIDLPRTRLNGLGASLEAVIQAANSGDVAELERALREVERVRTNTLNSLRNDMAQVAIRIDRLPIDQMFAPINEVGQMLQTAEEGILEFLEKWRRELSASRQFLENVEFSQVSTLLNTALDLIEDGARQIFVEPIDEAVEKLKTWLRNLLAHLHLVEYRNEITKFLLNIAQSIEDADLDGVAQDARKFLNDIEQAISGDLVGAVQGKINELKGQIESFMNDVGGALTQITTQINNIADQVRQVLEKVATELEKFKQTIDQITASIEQLGIEAATAQVVDTVTKLRQAAEEVLNEVALPEPLRPVIEQLIAEIEHVDLDAVFEPAYKVAEMDFTIPDEVTQGLEKMAEAFSNIIPEGLIAEIEAEVSQLLDVIREFDPATLLSGVTEKINEAANLIRELDPRPAVDAIRGPYQEALDLLDQVHPNQLLAPVIEAWDGLLGEVNLKSPQEAISNMSGSINTAGEALAQQAVAPIQQIAPQGMITPQTAADTPAQNQQNPVDLLPVKPGDVIRMFGYLPNKLREFINQLEAAAAAEFLAVLDGFGRGLAADLRLVPNAIMEVESRIIDAWDEMLSPIGPLQFGAQLAIEANFAGNQIDMNGSLSIVAAVRPGRLRAEMEGILADTLSQLHQTSVQLTTAAGNNLMYAVASLEQNMLNSLTQDLDAFLAALDPEPIAAELDALIATALQRAPEAIDEIGDDLIAAFNRLQKMVRDLNPVTLAQKFLTVIEVLEEQINLLDPRRLAAELAEIHRAIKDVFLAYDPAVFAQEIFEIIDALAAALEALNPATLLGDLADFDTILDQIEAAVPSKALAGIDNSLEAVGARIQALNPTAMIEAINDLPDRITEAIRIAVESIKAEILALLQAIKYASANASVSVSASASVG